MVSLVRFPRLCRLITTGFLANMSTHAGISTTADIIRSSLPISCVVAVTPNWGIGNSGTLPWDSAGIKLPGDMAHFKYITSQTIDPAKLNAVIMGRSTWESIPAQFRPLSGRLNVIVSQSDPEGITKGVDDTIVVSSFADALETIHTSPALQSRIERAVVIGGVRLFEEALTHPWFDTLYLTQVQRDFDCDTFLSEKTVEHLRTITLSTPVTSEDIVENGVPYRIVTYKKP